MAKFFKKKSEVTPLMSDEEPKSSSSSSRLSPDEQRRERKMKERAERRAKRDKRLADSEASKKKEEAERNNKKKLKSNKPKLSQAEQDAKDSKLGCCHKFGQFLVKTIHFIDAIIGIIFIVYGFLMLFNFDDPAMEAVITSLTFGWSMFVISVVGVIGFMTKVCSRCGMALSAYMAPFIAIFYVVIILVLLTKPEDYFDYLEDNADKMYLNDAEIATLRSLVPLFCIILGCLAGVEIARFIILRKLRHNLLRYDAASERIAASSNRSVKSSSSRSKKGSSRSKGSKKSDRMTEPLIESSDEEAQDYNYEDYY